MLGGWKLVVAAITTADVILDDKKRLDLDALQGFGAYFAVLGCSIVAIVYYEAPLAYLVLLGLFFPEKPVYDGFPASI